MTAPSCIDLRPICRERRWKWQFEPSFKAEHMRSTDADAPWYVEILCRNGLIYPYGGDDLLACIEDHQKVCTRLRAVDSEVRPHQGVVVFRFPLRLLDAVADVMRPRKKRPGNVSNLGRFARKSATQSNNKALELSETGEPMRGVTCSPKRKNRARDASPAEEVQ